MTRHHPNTCERIKRVQEIVKQHYEPGNNQRNYRQIWRLYVNPVYPMCYHTFLSYVRAKPSELS